MNRCMRLSIAAFAFSLFASLAISCTTPELNEKQVADIARKNAVDILSRESSGRYMSSSYLFELKGHRTTQLLRGIGWIDITYRQDGAIKARSGATTLVVGKYVLVPPGILPPLDTIDQLRATGEFSVRLHAVAPVAKSKGQYAPDTSVWEVLPFDSLGVIAIDHAGETRAAVAVFERSSTKLSFEAFPIGSLEELERDDLVYLAGEFIDGPSNIGAIRAVVLSVYTNPGSMSMAKIEGIGPYQEKGSTADGSAVFAINNKGDPEAVGVVVLSRTEASATRTYVLDLRFLLETIEKGKK